MSSKRRRRSSRINGRRSRGPVTPEGRQRSSQNAVRHGLLAQCIVLQEESRDNFEELLAQHLRRFKPADGVEFGMVEEMVSSYWRMRRAWALETRIIDNAIAAHPAGEDIDRIAGAVTDPATLPALTLMQRYEARFHHNYRRALRTLALLKSKEFPNEPNPISGHSPIPPNQ